MRAHEETWLAQDGLVYTGQDVDPAQLEDSDDCADFDNVERAQLAAQAPAMARLLAEVRDAVEADSAPPSRRTRAALDRTAEVLRAAGVIR